MEYDDLSDRNLLALYDASRFQGIQMPSGKWYQKGSKETPMALINRVRGEEIERRHREAAAKADQEKRDRQSAKPEPTEPDAPAARLDVGQSIQRAETSLEKTIEAEVSRLSRLERELTVAYTQAGIQLDKVREDLALAESLYAMIREKKNNENKPEVPPTVGNDLLGQTQERGEGVSPGVGQQDSPGKRGARRKASDG